MVKGVVNIFVILMYDIEAKRTNKALKICRKYLSWIQNSVFEGEITKNNLLKLKQELNKIIDLEYDSIFIYSFRSLAYSNREIIGIEKSGDHQFI